MLLVFNAAADGVEFTLPDCPGAENWSLLIDTNLPQGVEGHFKTGESYIATGRSVLLFCHENEAA